MPRKFIPPRLAARHEVEIREIESGGGNHDDRLPDIKPRIATIHCNLNIENLERPVSMDSENMTPETFRLPEDIKTARAFGDHPIGFGVELVTVFPGPFGVFFLMISHDLSR
jgi:hypothetical protein